MERVRAKVFNGSSWRIREIEAYSRAEAKKIVGGRDWEIESDVYSVNANGTCGDRIAFEAVLEDGSSIFVLTAVK